MFRITGPERVKVHYASTRAIAEEVVSNLKSRFSGNYTITNVPDNTFDWDPGGMKLTGQEVFDFELDHCTIGCDAQFFDYFVDHIQEYKPRGGYITKYVKIHAHYDCVCLTIEEFNNLKSLVQNPELAVKAEQVWGKKEEVLDKLSDADCIVRAVKDEDGNIYAVKPNENIDKKMLN